MRRSAPTSSYYPPRARRARWTMGLAQRLGRVRLPRASNLARTSLCLLVPGLAFYFAGLRRVGLGMAAASFGLLLVFVVLLGYPAADWAFMLMVSAHVTSLLRLLQGVFKEMRLAMQLIVGAVLFAGLSQLIYVPTREWFYAHVAMPLRTKGGVVVVNPTTQTTSIRRGDWIAYRIEGGYENGIVVRAGYGLGPVLALGGETVEFEAYYFRVAGTRYAKLPHMPDTGGEAVPTDHWFIWPEVKISTYYNAATVLASEMRKLALVRHENFVGRPYTRWFFRRQTAT